MENDGIRVSSTTPVDEAVVLDTPEEPKTSTAPPPPYELLVTSNKGFGVFATQDIKRGTRIVAEAPIIVIPSDSKISNLYKGFDKLTPEQHTQLSELASVDSFLTPSLKRGVRKRLEAKYSGRGLDAAVEDSLKMYCIFLTNNVHMGNDARYGSGVFLTYSRINHSCRRNVHNTYNPDLGKLTIHAIRDIKAGEELFTSYLSSRILTRQNRHVKLVENWGFECHCEVCDGPDIAMREARRERLEEIDKGMAVYEFGDPLLLCLAPHRVPSSDSEALAWVEESVKLLKEEGLIGFDLTYAYRECSKYSLKLGQAAKAMGYARKELEIEQVCLGDETQHLEQDVQGTKCWIQHLGLMSEQEAVKDRMNQKREAKEQKKAAKKAAKGGK